MFQLKPINWLKGLVIITIAAGIYISNVRLNNKHEEVWYPESGAMAAMEFWTNQRSYPNNFINEKAYTKAFGEKEFARLTLKSDLIIPWKPMGPLNRGGRMLAIAFNPLNPSTIYAGSASGGLWRKIF